MTTFTSPGKLLISQKKEFRKQSFLSSILMSSTLKEFSKENQVVWEGLPDIVNFRNSKVGKYIRGHNSTYSYLINPM